jgi:cytochrome c553
MNSFMRNIAKVTTIAAVLIAFAPAFGADAKTNWEKQCAKCHGMDGKGQTKMGKQSGAKDYTDPKVQAEFTDEQGFKAVKEGFKVNGKEAMKPSGDKLTDAEIKELVAYARTFAKK